MSQKTLSGSIALTKLIHVKMQVKGKSGLVDGIFVPFEANKLDVVTTQDGSQAVYMPIRFIYKPEQDERGQNGFIAKAVTPEEYKKADTDEKKEALKAVQPILGNLKDWSQNESSNNDSGGAASNDRFNPEDDELPF